MMHSDARSLDRWENEGGFTTSTAWQGALLAADLSDESAVRIELAGLAICLARSNGMVHALLDECSHGQVALSDGDVDDGVVECWLHGSCFDLTTGVPTGPPATQAVPVYRTRVVSGVIEIAID